MAVLAQAHLVHAAQGLAAELGVEGVGHARIGVLQLLFDEREGRHHLARRSLGVRIGAGAADHAAFDAADHAAFDAADLATFDSAFFAALDAVVFLLVVLLLGLLGLDDLGRIGRLNHLGGDDGLGLLLDGGAGLFLGRR